jgi:xanthine/uracil permease
VVIDNISRMIFMPSPSIFGAAIFLGLTTLLASRFFPLKQEVWEKLIPATINGQFNALYGWETMPGVYGKVCAIFLVYHVKPQGLIFILCRL